MLFCKANYIPAGRKLWMVTITLLFASVSFAKDSKVINVADTLVEPNVKENIKLVVPKGDKDPVTFIPLSVVHGKTEGPVLAVVAGVHGYEYTSILAVNKWVEQLDPNLLRGTVIVVRAAHVSAFEERSIYVNPYDRKNLNRSFPGKEKGTQTERIAWAISEHVVAKSDFLIDLHSGDGGEWLAPFIGVYGGPLSTNFPLALTVAKGFNFPNIVRYSMNTQEQIDRKRSLNRQGVAMKIPTILVEIGENGSKNNDHVNAMIRGLDTGLSILGISPTKSIFEQTDARYFEGTNSVPVAHSGLWFPTVVAGQFIKKGQILGELQDYFGNTIEVVLAPISGYGIYGLTGPAIKKGQSIMTIAKPVAEFP